MTQGAREHVWGHLYASHFLDTARKLIRVPFIFKKEREMENPLLSDCNSSTGNWHWLARHGYYDFSAGVTDLLDKGEIRPYYMIQRISRVCGVEFIHDRFSLSKKENLLISCLLKMTVKNIVVIEREGWGFEIIPSNISFLYACNL